MTAVQPTVTVNENISTYLLTEKNISSIFSTSIYNISTVGRVPAVFIALLSPQSL